ncbi:hypothetical protein CAPTEDRAFT_189983 [Capitella teleta]|uniref:Uncharacterized protein n=1 Tax=Capitella teleta TaxID=283909 RepID=R7U3N3_CAPTE|nr:hypothetical protein CAPTEDRAFT_189983 [Capitella teleta]|eukprot:ELT98276.1 hypothetical protein CAPTEDRAFT_189983 [Capitella teleta]
MTHELGGHTLQTEVVDLRAASFDHLLHPSLLWATLGQTAWLNHSIHFLFPNLQTLRTICFASGRIRRAVLHVGDLSAEEKYDKMAAAFQDLVTTFHAHISAEHIGEINEQILQSSGLDIRNLDHIREEACKYTS